MGNKGIGGSGQDKAVGLLRLAVWILTALLVSVVIELSYWWASQEKIIADQKIERIKNELKICRKEKENE
jgi:hypothetical protein